MRVYYSIMTTEVPLLTTFADTQKVLRTYYANAQTKYTLDNMCALMDHIGSPQEKIRVVHVAGTSGKTSTSYYAAALLRAAGLQVGLSVSPHVDQINERLQINGQPLSEAEFCQVLTEFLNAIKDAPVKPSYFELLTAMAFWEYARRGVDAAVMEVGLGGLLDATNVISRRDKICLITDIGLDHTEILGDTLVEIAQQKAGIIQPGNQVFAFAQGPEVMSVLRAHGVHELSDNDNALLPQLPHFQQRNLGLARAGAEAVLGRGVTDKELALAATTVVPARLEKIAHKDKIVLVDGSHNAQKMAAMLDGLQQLYPDQKPSALVAFVAGHNQRWQEAITTLLPHIDQLIITEFYSEKDYPKHSVQAQTVADFAGRGLVVPEPEKALDKLLQMPGQIVLVTGSFYLLNHIRPRLLHD